MLRTQDGLRLLGPADLPAMLELAGLDPVVNVFADYRARLTQLEPRWLGGEMWGYHEGGRLVSACHSAANLVPVQTTPAYDGPGPPTSTRSTRPASRCTPRRSGCPRRSGEGATSTGPGSPS